MSDGCPIGLANVHPPSLVGSIMGLLLYNKEKWGWGLTIQQLFFLNAMFPVVFMGPWVHSLRETAVVTGSIPVKERMREQVRYIFSSRVTRSGVASHKRPMWRAPDVSILLFCVQPWLLVLLVFHTAVPRK